MIDEVTGPLTVHYHSRDVLIADAGYSWFQAAVPGARWWLTAMFDECDRLIQIYFDITGGSRFDDPENPTFEDMYLDIVVSADGSIEVVDRDELDEACKAARSPSYSTKKQSRTAKSWRSFSVKIRPPSWTGAVPCSGS